MLLVIVLLGYIEYLGIRWVLLKFTDIKLDILPDRYYDDPKRTWTNASILLICFLITSAIFMIIFEGK